MARRSLFALWLCLSAALYARVVVAPPDFLGWGLRSALALFAVLVGCFTWWGFARSRRRGHPAFVLLALFYFAFAALLWLSAMGLITEHLYAIAVPALLALTAAGVLACVPDLMRANREDGFS